ncbi:MAG: 5'-methylthioadenosine/adenosylhomocysteine nucleosidase [Clostridia bacterium]|nr:5'-methylthioadenosine/adenosylhomocysteine nucleosidase [Clostridia bacterium]
MKNIGIIAAMNEEMLAIKSIMKNIEEEKVYDLMFIKGTINEKNCILVESGVGKVNSSRTTQILIDKFNIEYVINVGSAAASNNELNIGDIVIGETLVQHDFDITAFGHEKGYISNVGKNIKSDTELIKKFDSVIKNMNNEIEDKINIKIGVIASGDIFCTEEMMKNKIRSKFNADAIEMEGAAIAQVCYLDKIPFIVIRSISDTPNGNNNITFEKYLELAADRCKKILEKFIL